MLAATQKLKTSCYSTDSQRPPRCCLLANNVDCVEYIDRRHAWVCSCPPKLDQKCLLPLPNTPFLAHPDCTSRKTSIDFSILAWIILLRNIRDDREWIFTFTFSPISTLSVPIPPNSHSQVSLIPVPMGFPLGYTRSKTIKCKCKQSTIGKEKTIP